MQLDQPNTDILLIGNTIPFDKEFKDIKHGETLEQKTIIFKDGDDEFANILLLKVGVNGNGWGVGQETFEERADEFLLNPVLVDPDGKVHASNPNGTGKYPLSHILENQNPLVAGLITKVMKYDTNNDGKPDLARGIMKVSKDPEKRERFHKAIKEGINETSPTLLPLDINEPAQKLLTYKPVNVVFTKNGAYLEHAKVKALCKGSERSCHNALAASLQNEKNNVSLIQQLQNNGNMSSNEGTNAAAPPAGGTSAGQPVFNISYANPLADNKTVTNDSNTQQTQEPKKPEPTAEQIELERLRKQNKQLVEDNLTSLRNELAPADLFEKEDDLKLFHKELGDDLEKVKWFRNVAKMYVPRMIALYEKSKSQQPQEPKKDEKGNPLAASLGQINLPKFNNDATNGNDNPALNLLKNHSLKELYEMNRRLARGNDE